MPDGRKKKKNIFGDAVYRICAFDELCAFCAGGPLNEFRYQYLKMHSKGDKELYKTKYYLKHGVSTSFQVFHDALVRQNKVSLQALSGRAVFSFVCDDLEDPDSIYPIAMHLEWMQVDSALTSTMD